MKYLVTLVIAISTLQLTGCITTSMSGVDEEQPVAIVWHKVDNPHAACQKLSSQPQLFRVLGCSTWKDVEVISTESNSKSRSRVCHIYARQPVSHLDYDRFKTLGHEMMHCFNGQWHDKYGRYNENVRVVKEEAEAAVGAHIEVEIN
jgi:hypothetical protein